MAFHNTTDATGSEPDPNQVAALLSGEQGPAKSLQVHPGDTVRLQVNCPLAWGSLMRWLVCICTLTP